MDTNNFERIIIDALATVNYSGHEDNRRFLAAVQDLASGYPNEKKFLQHNVNENYLEICSEAFRCDPEQVPTISRKASDYLQKEYMTAEKWADDMSEAITRAFSIYGGKTPAVHTALASSDEIIEKSDEVKSVQKRPKSNKGIIIVAVAAVVAVAAFICIFALSGGDEFDAPDLSGMTLKQAEAIAEELNINVEKGEEVISDKMDKGLIVSQTPEAGKPIKRGDTIKVNISKGYNNESDNNNESDEDNVATYEENGISFSIPGKGRSERYYYYSQNGSHEIAIEEGEPDLAWDGLKAFWAMQLGDDPDGDNKEVGSGELTIDGEDCYWVEKQHSDGYWDKSLYLPQHNENYYVSIDVSTWEKNEIEEANQCFKEIVDEIEFTDDDTTAPDGSMISRFGIQFPSHGAKLSFCSYDDYCEELPKSLKNLYSAAFLFGEYDYAGGVDGAVKELKKIDDDSSEVLEGSGDIEIDGVSGKWCAFNDPEAFANGTIDGSYFVLFPDDRTKQIVEGRFCFYGDINKHSDTIKEITDSIRFTK